MKITALLLLPLLALLQGGGPKPRPPAGLGADTIAEEQSTTYFARLFWRWAQQGPAPDSAITRVWNESAFTVPNTPVATVPAGAHRFAASRTRDSFNMTKPLAGTSRTVWLCVNGKRGAAPADTSPPACTKTTFFNPTTPLPPPVIDSATSDTVIVALRILPRFAALDTLRPGDFRLICIVATLPSGRAGYRGARTSLCDTQALARGRPVTPTGQATIDRSCFALTVQPPASWTGPIPLVTDPAIPCHGLQSLSVVTVAGLGFRVPNLWKPS